MAEGVVSSWVKDAKKNAGWLIFLGVVSVIVGVMAIGSPMVAGMSVAMVVGFFMVVSGLSQLAGAFKAGSFGSEALSLIGGIVTTLVGFLMFFRPLFGVKALALILAVYFLTEGISGIALAFKVRPEKGWGWMLFSSTLALLLAWFIFKQWPLSGAWAIGTLVGIHILFRGFSFVAIGVAARSGLSTVQDALKEGEAST